MTEKLIPFDASEFLDSQEAINCFMQEAFDSGDASYIAHALHVATRATHRHAITPTTATPAHAPDESDTPTLNNLLTAMQALGLRLVVQSTHTATTTPTA